MEKENKNFKSTGAQQTRVDPEQVVCIRGKLEDSILQDRYQIQRKLDAGSFGKIYKCIDAHDRLKPLVIKISEDQKFFLKEIKAMKSIHNYEKSSASQSLNSQQSGSSSIQSQQLCQMIKTPEVLANGVLTIIPEKKINNREQEPQSLYYMIMPRYGNNLENYFASINCRLSKISVASLGLSVLNCFEKVHKAGFVYNDLKLDNIMVGFGQKLPEKYVEDDAFLNSDINLIDFGFSTSYINHKTKELLPKKVVSNFRGNMVFASQSQLDFYSTGPRDDIISLGFLMIYLLLGGSLPSLNIHDNKLSTEECFKKIRSTKIAYTLADLCPHNQPTDCLSAFICEAFVYRFNDLPNYVSLRNHLENIILKERQRLYGVSQDSWPQAIQRAQSNLSALIANENGFKTQSSTPNSHNSDFNELSIDEGQNQICKQVAQITHKTQNLKMFSKQNTPPYVK